MDDFQGYEAMIEVQNKIMEHFFVKDGPIHSLGFKMITPWRTEVTLYKDCPSCTVAEEKIRKIDPKIAITYTCGWKKT